MISSAIFHLFKDISANSHKLLAKFDYAGISFMIAGSCTPPVYYSFICEETSCNFLGLTVG